MVYVLSYICAILWFGSSMLDILHGKQDSSAIDMAVAILWGIYAEVQQRRRKSE